VALTRNWHRAAFHVEGVEANKAASGWHMLE
jgi:hypothetical protein